MARQVIQKKFFTYNINFASLAATASSTGSFTVQADADFHVYKLAYFADIAAAIQTDSSRVIPLCTVLITDTGSASQLMDSAVPLSSLFGEGDKPFILPYAYPIKASSNVQATLTNFSAATTYALRLSFIGVKVYYKDV
jgi:hypothetical protein